MDNLILQASKLIKQSNHLIAFTGAGISVESGIPPFRGKGGLYETIDPKFLHIDYFCKEPLKSWQVNKKIFYDLLKKVKENSAHKILAKLETKGFLKSIITQNIDNLHQQAGSKNVYEFHGNAQTLVCINCKNVQNLNDNSLDNLPPRCEKCQGILKPNFIFFGEAIPKQAYKFAYQESNLADLVLIIGTTGMIQPACLIPENAKKNGAKIIEINPNKSAFTDEITDLFLQGKASLVLKKLVSFLN